MLNSVFIVLAAGRGTRMNSDIPKVLHKICGVEMVSVVISKIQNLRNATNDTILVVCSDDNIERIAGLHPEVKTVIQKERLGTGHAVKTAMDEINKWQIKPQNIVVVYGDTPLVSEATLLRATNSKDNKHDISFVGFVSSKSDHKYGRFAFDANKLVIDIVEYKDSGSTTLKVSDVCNSGVVFGKFDCFAKILPQIENKNVSGEYYLTDIPKIANKMNINIGMVAGDESEFLGINNMIELAVAEGFLQSLLREKAMIAGVHLVSPDTVTLGFDTVFGRDVVIEPNIYIGKGVIIGDNVTIKAFCYLEGVKIDSGSNIGPFARIRGNSNIGGGSKIGNFVEIKNSNLSNNVKAGHLSYIGDADIGDGTNIGAGTVFCNYDGVNKYRTTVGSEVFIGSNSSLIAPVYIADDSFIAAGSVITKPTEAFDLAIGRSQQRNIKGWGKKKKLT